MSAPFEYFEVKPSGLGEGDIRVKTFPHDGIFTSFWRLVVKGEESNHDAVQEFIADAIREKLEREGKSSVRPPQGGPR